MMKKEMEAEFASWQAKVGPDFESIEGALKPVERYALRFRTDPQLDPYYSVYFLTEQQKLESAAVSEDTLQQDMWDVEEIEREKQEEENRAFAEGELLATSLTSRDISRFRSWYKREREKRNADRRRRILTGAGWDLVSDSRTGYLFWYNKDTGESRWQKPQIVEEREAMQIALEKGYNAAPLNVVINIVSFLKPCPDRLRAAEVCCLWADGVEHASFHLRVLPVESGVKEDTKSMRQRYGHNAYASIAEAIEAAQPGDTIALDPGHHWEDDLIVDKPLRFYGQTDDPTRCVIELTGAFKVRNVATQVHLSGLTIRRPRRVPKQRACLSVAGKTRVSLFWRKYQQRRRLGRSSFCQWMRDYTAIQL